MSLDIETMTDCRLQGAHLRAGAGSGTWEAGTVGLDDCCALASDVPGLNYAILITSAFLQEGFRMRNYSNRRERGSGQTTNDHRHLFTSLMTTNGPTQPPFKVNKNLDSRVCRS